MRKKFTLLLASLFLVMGTAWADNMWFDAKSTPALPGTMENNQYTWKSSEMTAPDGFTTLRLTFLENVGEGKDAGDFPHVALAEFYLYNKDGQPVPLTEGLLSSNATETNEGNSGIGKLCDGNTTQGNEGQYDWYWHSYWSANAGAHHYLEINVAGISNLSTFSVGYVSRQSDGTPTEILVTTGSSTADVAAQYNSYMLFSKYDLSAQAFRIKNSNITNEERFLTIETPNLNNRDEDGVKILPKSYGDESEAQAWKFIPQDDGTYRIQSASGYFLNNHGGWGINAEDDTQGHELDNPKFTLEYLKDGEFRIKSASGYVGPNNDYSTSHPYEMFGNHTKDNAYLDWKLEPYTKQYIITCEYVLGDKSVSTTSYCVEGETYSFSNPYEFTTVASCTKNGDALTASDGTYSFTATGNATVTIVLEENLPFTPTTITDQGAFADNTVWYILMQKTTNNYWKYYSEGDNNVRATTSGNSIYDEKQMWCFTGNALEGFKIYNKSLGTNHSLSNGDPAKLVENNAQTWYARESNKAFAASDIRFGLARPGKTGNSEYANLQTANDVLKGWSLDNGSTTCAVPITKKYEEIAAAWEKLLTIEEVAIGSLATTEGFQTLIDAYKATPSQETENAVNEFIAANDLELENDCYYMIVSAYGEFKNKQGVEKAIYSDNSDLKWATRDNGSKAYYWQAVTVDDQLRFKNCNDGSYMAVKTTTTDGSTSTDIVMWNGEASADASVSYNAMFAVGTTNVLTQLNLNLGNVGNLHANYHGEGGGNSGNIIFFGSGANGASAWRLIKSEHPDLAAAKAALQNKIDELNQIISKAGMVGYYTADACEALKEPVAIALDVLNGGSTTVADYTTALTTLNNNTASLDKTIVLPVDGKAYTFMNVMGETADAKRYYMKYVNGEKVSVSTSSEDASVFVCKKLRDGVYVFITADGKFLTWIGNDETGSYKENDQILGYSSHYAAECNSLSDWNEITVKPNGEEAKDFGYLRLVARRKSGSTSAFIANVNNRFDQASDSYWFNSTNSSAWILTEVNHTNTLEQEAALAETDATVAAIAHVTENGSKLGDGLGYSYYMDGEAKITTAAAAKTAINNATTAEAVEAIHESFELDVPQGGKFYRLKGISGNYIDASSIYNNANATSGQMSMKSEADANLAGTIFYLDEENHFLNYATGTYVRQTREIGNVGDAKGVWSFAESPRTPGTLALSCTTTGNAGQHLHDNAGNRADRCDRNCGNSHDWTVEEVTTLPVTITAAGYATLYAPVALTIADGVKAYTATVEGSHLSLNEVEGVIPAKTGVILEADPKTYNFAVAADVAAIEDNALVGSYAKSVKNAVKKVYTLQKPEDEEVGFYLFKGYTDENDQEGTKTYINGFRAWIELDADSQVQALALGRGEGTTAIDNAQLATDNVVIYDLTGRRVEKMEKGIYIVNGKKVVIK